MMKIIRDSNYAIALVIVYSCFDDIREEHSDLFPCLACWNAVDLSVHFPGGVVSVKGNVYAFTVILCSFLKANAFQQRSYTREIC